MGLYRALAVAATAAVALSGVARAADLLPPPPPPAPYVAPYDPGQSGWYLRGDVGVAVNRERMSTSFQDPTFNPVAAGVAINQQSISDSAYIDAGIGYQFNSWLRADLTGEYRSEASTHAIESYTNAQITGAPVGTGYCGPLTGANAQTSCYDSYTGSMRSIDFMANAYVDLGTWYNLTPYVGAGVGVAYNWLGNITDQAGNNTGFGFSQPKGSTNLAWALMTGLDYRVNNNLKLELGYRYLNLGSATASPIICSLLTGCHFEVHKYALSSNDIHLGMLWTFGGEEHVQPVSWGPAPQEPIVKRF